MHLHFTPTTSWLNLVGRFFAEVTQRRIRRGVFKSVNELEDAMRAYPDHRNHLRPRLSDGDRGRRDERRRWCGRATLR